MASWGWDEAQRAAFLQMEYQAQRLTYQRAYPNAEHALIIYQGEPVGRILINRGPAEPLLPQQTYRMEHEEMGELTLLLVPVGRDETGFTYEAVFNRLVEVNRS